MLGYMKSQELITKSLELGFSVSGAPSPIPPLSLPYPSLPLSLLSLPFPIPLLSLSSPIPPLPPLPYPSPPLSLPSPIPSCEYLSIALPLEQSSLTRYSSCVHVLPEEVSPPHSVMHPPPPLPICQSSLPLLPLPPIQCVNHITAAC